MRIIDGHIHIGQWGSVFLNYGTTVRDAVNVLKESGIESAVALPADNEPNEKLLADIKQTTDFTFYFAAWINPDDNNLFEFIEKNLNDIPFFKFHPSFQRRKITDESYRRYLEIAEATQIPCIVHCGRWREIAGFEYPLEIAKKMPRLNLILAHLGGDQPSLCTACAREVKNGNYKNVYLGTESVREFYFVEQVIKTAGADRIIFGSDYNLGHPRMYISLIDSLNISSDEKEKIFYGNILKLIKG